jgi:hypothetical protein
MLRENPGFFQASLSDPFEATRETILYMCGLVRESASDPAVQEAAADAVKRFGNRPGAPALVGDSNSPGGKAECVWWWVKHALKFVHHSKLMQLWGVGDGHELQLLINPGAALRMEKPRGDCAVFTTLICAMLDQLGVPWEIVTVAVNPHEPEIFSHVYPRAILESGMRLVLDASHGKYPGWEVPKRRQYLKQVWSSEGEAIADQDSGYRGLHGMQGMNWENEGLGQDDGSGDTTTDISETTTTMTSDGGSAPASPGVTAAELALMNSGISLVGKVVAPTVTYTGPGGTSLTAPASSSVASSLLSSLTSGTSLGGVSSSVLLLGGLALAAMLLIPMLSKK